MTRRRRRALACALVLAAVLVLGGCVVIRSESDGQLEVIGDVQLTTEICFSGSDDCADQGNSGFNHGDEPMQVLVGYRIPVASTPPASFSQASGRAVDFTRSESYTSELQRLAPAPAGQKWVGYISGVEDYMQNVDASFTLQNRFQLLRGGDGSPFVGPFAYRTVVGRRDAGADPSETPERPVDCGDSLTEGNSSDGETICVDSPDEEELPANRQLATRDLGVLPTAPAHVRAGKAGSVGFTLKFAGAGDPAANFALSATTAAPGVTAAPERQAFQPPSDSSTPLAVRVAAPGNARGGTHEVTLTARLASGQTRSAVSRVTIHPDRSRPAIRVAGVRTACATRRLRVRVRERNARSVRVTVDRSRVASRRSAGFLRVRIPARLLGTGRHVLRVTAEDQAGNRRTVRRTITCGAARVAPRPRRRDPSLTG